MDAAGPVLEGYSQAGQYKTQAALAAQQAKDVDLQSLQTSGQRREQLNSALSTISANRVQSGLSIDSPTGQAIAQGVRQRAVRDEQINRVGFLNQGQALRWQTAALKKAAKHAIIGGYLKGYAAIEQDAAKAAGA